MASKSTSVIISFYKCAHLPDPRFFQVLYHSPMPAPPVVVPGSEQLLGTCFWPCECVRVIVLQKWHNTVLSETSVYKERVPGLLCPSGRWCSGQLAGGLRKERGTLRDLAEREGTGSGTVAHNSQIKFSSRPPFSLGNRESTLSPPKDTHPSLYVNLLKSLHLSEGGVKVVRTRMLLLTGAYWQLS